MRSIIKPDKPQKGQKMRRAGIVIGLVGVAGWTATFAAGAAGPQAGPAEPPDQQVAPFVKTVQAHPGMPPFAVRITPGPPSAKEGTTPYPIGRVEISRQGEPKPFQTLTVTGNSPHDLTFSRFEDANFDGYADLLLGHDHGAKWEGYEIHFYDPASGRFVENDLSREMSEQLRGQNLYFPPATREIELTFLVFGCQDRPVAEKLVIQGSHLRTIERTDRVRTQEGCYVVTLRAGNDGALEEMSRRRIPELDRDHG
jgi:hypothetical protein